MKSIITKGTTIAFLGLFAAQHVRSQGTFSNLDFESPIVPLIPDVQFTVPTSSAVPGWTAFVGGSAVDRVVYNTVSLGAAAVSLQGPGSSIPSLQGSYSVGLQGSQAGQPTAAAIAQTGQIPLNAESILFFLFSNSSIELSFAGQPVSLVQVSATPQYTVMGGSISAFAGQVGELRFTALTAHGGLLDNIQFSDRPVPEPGVATLCGLGALLFSWRVLRRQQ